MKCSVTVKPGSTRSCEPSGSSMFPPAMEDAEDGKVAFVLRMPSSAEAVMGTVGRTGSSREQGGHHLEVLERGSAAGGCRPNSSRGAAIMSEQACPSAPAGTEARVRTFDLGAMPKVPWESMSPKVRTGRTTAGTLGAIPRLSRRASLTRFLQWKFLVPGGTAAVSPSGLPAAG